MVAISKVDAILRVVKETEPGAEHTVHHLATTAGRVRAADSKPWVLAVRALLSNGTLETFRDPARPRSLRVRRAPVPTRALVDGPPQTTGQYPDGVLQDPAALEQGYIRQATEPPPPDPWDSMSVSDKVWHDYDRLERESSRFNARNPGNRPAVTDAGPFAGTAFEGHEVLDRRPPDPVLEAALRAQDRQ